MLVSVLITLFVLGIYYEIKFKNFYYTIKEVYGESKYIEARVLCIVAEIGLVLFVLYWILYFVGISWGIDIVESIEDFIGINFESYYWEWRNEMISKLLSP